MSRSTQSLGILTSVAYGYPGHYHAAGQERVNMAVDDTLTGKRALVCGSSQGIGRACALALARQGAEVVVVARDEAALQDLTRQLPTAAGRRHRALPADFRDPDTLRAKVTDLLKETGPIQILVNNSGGPPHGPIIDATPDQFLGAISQHVVCNQLLVQALLPGMKHTKYGRIVNIISTSVIAPIQGLGVSNTTRGAVANWARTVAGELAPLGITVNNVLPGYTETNRLAALLEAKAKRLKKTPEDVKQSVVASIPMGRLASPDEIAAVVAFLASPAASYISGVNLPVDGARTAVQ